MGLFSKMTTEEREKAELYAAQQIDLGNAMERLVGNKDFKKVFVDYRGEWIKIVYRQLTEAIMNKDAKATAELEDTLRWLKGIDKYVEYVGNYSKVGLDTIEALSSEVDYAE